MGVQMAFKVGLDIGYSNLKVAFGEEAEEPTLKCLPAGAMKAELMPQQISGEPIDEHLKVLVGDVPWVAGLPQTDVLAGVRNLSENYPATDQYLALARAAMMLTEEDKIDHLVTGLPSHQYHLPQMRKQVIDLLQGEHKVAGKRKIRVEKVSVVPQPLGGYLTYVDTLDDDGLDFLHEQGQVLVVDPGFFSFDWALFQRGNLVKQHTNSDKHAMSSLAEEIQKGLKNGEGQTVPLSRIEHALRTSASEIRVSPKRKVPLAEYLGDAKKQVCELSVMKLTNSRRNLDQNPDVIVLVGGGAEVFRDSVVAAFDGVEVFTTTDPVLANAKGFWLLGRER